MLGAFVEHGMTQEQLESETLTQMYEASTPFVMDVY